MLCMGSPGSPTYAHKEGGTKWLGRQIWSVKIDSDFSDADPEKIKSLSRGRGTGKQPNKRTAKQKC
jgi:hypothetical protein